MANITNSPSTIVNDTTVGSFAWTNPSNAGASDNSYSVSENNDSAEAYSVKIVKSDGSFGSENKSGETSFFSEQPEKYYSYGGSTDLWSETWSASDINDSDFGVVFSVGDSYQSYYLKATNFGFSIPTGSIIDGIEAQVELLSSDNISVSVDHIRITVYYTEVKTYTADGRVKAIENETFTADGRVKGLSNIKKYIYKIYNSDGFVSTIKEVSDEPRFTSYINSGLGELTIRLPRSVFQFEEGTVIAQNNQLKVVCFDNDSSTGVTVYNGYISKYTPTLDRGKEFVTVTCLGYITETERFMAEDASGNTTLTYNSYDPTNILKDVLDKYSSAGGTLDYTATSTEDTSTTVSYQLNTYTVKEALDKVVELSPSGWYYFADADNVINFASKDATANHTFSLGKDVVTIIPEKSTEEMVNRIYFTGGDVSGTTFYKKYERSGSISTYGLYSKKYIDARVTDESTADIMAGAILDRNDTPETRTTLVIRDNNNDDGRGYDIESIKPGDTCKVIGYTETATNQWDSGVWDVDKWDYDITQVSATVQQIMKVSYQPNQVTLEISSKLPNISNRVEDIKRNLDRTQTNNNPSAPTT